MRVSEETQEEGTQEEETQEEETQEEGTQEEGTQEEGRQEEETQEEETQEEETQVEGTQEEEAQEEERSLQEESVSEQHIISRRYLIRKSSMLAPMLGAVFLLFVTTVGKHFVSSSRCDLDLSTESHSIMLDGDVIIGGIMQLNYVLDYTEIKIEDMRTKPSTHKCLIASLHYLRHISAFVFAVEEINKQTDLLPNITLGFQIYDTCILESQAIESTLTILTGQEKIIPNYSCNVKNTVAAFIGHHTFSSTFSTAILTGIYRYPQAFLEVLTMPISCVNPPLMINFTVQANCLGGIDAAQLHREEEPLPPPVGDNLQVSQQRAHIISEHFTFCKDVSHSSQSEQLMMMSIPTFHDHANVTLHHVCSCAIIVHLLHPISYGYTDPVFNNRIHFTSLFNLAPNKQIQATAVGLLLQHFGWSWVGIVSSDNDSNVRKSLELQEAIVSSGGCVEFTIYINYTETQGPNIRKAVNVIVKSSCKVIILNTDLLILFILLDDIAERSDISKMLIVPPAQSMFQVSHGSLSIVGHSGNIPGLREFLLSGDIRKYTDSTILSDVYVYALYCFFPNITYCKDKTSFRNLDPADYDVDNFRLTHYVYAAVYAIAHALHGMYLKSNSNASDIKQLRQDWHPWMTPHSVCSESCPPGFRKAPQNGRPKCCYDCVPCSEGEYSNSTDMDNCMKCQEDRWPDINRVLCIPRSIEFLSYQEQLGEVLVALATSFSLVTVAVLAKTMTVVIAFNALKPNSKLRKLVGSRIPSCLVLFFSLGEVLICVVWWIHSPPFPDYDTHSEQAFLVRKLPDAFNEAQYITFSMVVFCTVWVSFIPAYLSTKGKYMVAVESFVRVSLET
ncbi:vomeronasal type-2 receptor 26-like [Discoglossus pictus]